jgi:hypothetical protein
MVEKYAVFLSCLLGSLMRLFFFARFTGTCPGKLPRTPTGKEGRKEGRRKPAALRS